MLPVSSVCPMGSTQRCCFLRSSFLPSCNSPARHVSSAQPDDTSGGTSSSDVATPSFRRDKAQCRRVSWKDGNTAGVCMVVRDNNRQFMAATSKFPTHGMSLMVVEGMGLRWALSLAVDLGFRMICMETNCTFVSEL